MASLPYIAYFIADGRVQSGAVVHVNEPVEEGSDTLYDFGHGFSTPVIYKTKEEAEAAL